MKRFIVPVVVALTLLLATPVLAAGFGISPPSVEFDVPADGSAEVEFLVYDFTGDLEISLEDIPLRVEPTTVTVTAKEEGTRVVLTFHGDESLGSQVFEGKIRFLAMTGGMVAMGIKVKATVNHIAAGQPLPTPTETTPTPTQTPTPTNTVTVTPPPEGPPESNEWIIPVAGIIAGAALLITIIIILARRRRY